jgi:hypothetical protein
MVFRHFSKSQIARGVIVSIKRLVAMPFIVSLIVGGTMVGAASTASAIPSDCSISYGEPRTVSSFCASGTGQHRIRMLQRHFNPAVGLIPIEGPWANVGAYSTSGYTPHVIESVWVETR